MKKELRRLKKKFNLLLPKLNERDRRLAVAAEAISLGFGGITKVYKATGIARTTITTGIHELEGYTPVQGRIRKVGGGRKLLSSHYPGLVKALKKAAKPSGNPESPLLYTTRSMEHIDPSINIRTKLTDL